jgi:hypothetical protein
MNKIANIVRVGALFALAMLAASCEKKAGPLGSNPCIQHGQDRTLYVSIYTLRGGSCDVDYAIVNLSTTMKDKIQWYSNDPNLSYEVRFDQPEGSPFQQTNFKVDGNGSTPNPALHNPTKTYYTYSVYPGSGSNKCRDATEKKDGVDPGVHITP